MKSLDLVAIWSWLPTFRVVAESRSLQEASRILEISPSSVSRTIRLLEAEIGKTLFDRDGAALRTTRDGDEFLENVRRAMREVDEGLTRLRGPSAAGPCRIVIPRALVSILAVPMMARVRERDPNISFHVDSLGGERELVAGMVDVLVSLRPSAPTLPVDIQAVGEVALHLYCSREHPLSSQAPSASDVLAHAFVETDRALEEAAWERAPERTVGLKLPDFASSLDACTRSLGIAVLPASLAKRGVASRSLTKLDSIETAPVKLFVVRRPSLSADRVDVVVDSLRATLSEA